jgi:hypothetical protein
MEALRAARVEVTLALWSKWIAAKDGGALASLLSSPPPQLDTRVCRATPSACIAVALLKLLQTPPSDVFDADADAPEWKVGGEGTPFRMASRSVDLRTPAGRTILEQIVAQRQAQAHALHAQVDTIKYEQDAKEEEQAALEEMDTIIKERKK